MAHSSCSLAGSSPSSLFLGVLGVGVVWKGLFEKGPEGPLARPNSCPAVPLVAHPHHNPQPLTKALTSQQKCVQQRQQLLYSCNERSLFLGSQGDARGSFQSVWGYWLRLKNILSAAKIKKNKNKLPKFLWMWCNVKWNQQIKKNKKTVSQSRKINIDLIPPSLTLCIVSLFLPHPRDPPHPPHPPSPQAGAADERGTERAWKALSWQSSWPPGFSPLLHFYFFKIKNRYPPTHSPVKPPTSAS